MLLNPHRKSRQALIGACTLLLLCVPPALTYSHQPGSSDSALTTDSPHISTSRSGESEIPPWQRMLTGDDKERTADLEEQIAELRMQGRYVEAIPLANEVLATRQRVQGLDHWQSAGARHVLDTLNQIVLLQHDLQEELAEADAIEARVKVLTWEPKAELELIDWIDRDTLEQIRMDLEVQLEIRRRILGSDHPDTLQTFHLMSSLLEDQGKFLEAEQFILEALEGRRRVLGEDHRDTLWTLVRSNYVSYGLGTYLMRIEEISRTLEQCRSVLGNDNFVTLRAMYLMGRVFSDQGRYSEAEDLLLECLDGHRRLLGENHSKSLLSMCLLGNIYARRGDDLAGEAITREALTRSRRELGEEDRATSICLYCMGHVFIGQCRLNEAGMMFRQMADGLTRSKGRDHTYTMTAYQDLSWILEDQGEYAEAELLLREARDTFIRHTGKEDSQWVFWASRNLGNLLMARGRLDEAEELLREAVSGLRRTGGENYLLTHYSISSLGRLLRSRGEVEEAERLLRELTERKLRVFGIGHQDLIWNLNVLGFLYFGEGDLRAAEEAWTRAAESYEVTRMMIGAGGLDRTSFSATLSPLESLTVFLALKGRPVAAWRRFEANLSRGLLDTVASRDTRPFNAAENSRRDDLIDRLGKVNERISTLAHTDESSDEALDQASELSRERDECLTELAGFNAEMMAKYGIAAGEVYELGRIQAHLAPDSALLGWVDVVDPQVPDQFNEHWACLVRHAGQPVWVRLPGSGKDGVWTGEDKALAHDLRSRLRRWDTGPVLEWGQRELLQRLYNQRLAPLEPYLNGIRHLIILPAGSMAGIPLEALTDEYTISYAPSGTLFAWLREREGESEQNNARAPGALLALGDPVYRPLIEGIAELPAPPDHGVVVAWVRRGAAGERSGLRSGDVLLHQGEKRLNSPADLAQAGKPGSSLPLSIWREGEIVVLNVPAGDLGLKLDQRPALEAIQARRLFDAALERTRGFSFDPLPNTRREVELINELFSQEGDGLKSMMLLGSDASEERLESLSRAGRLKQFRYLHLAAHGEMDDQVAMRSALILSQDRLTDSMEQVLSGGVVYDGRLTGEQIALTWKLDADLVTLSGCETALGKASGGEGYLGFSQALFVAGARSLLLSLWGVDDRATMMLMKRFYENLLGRFEETRHNLGRDYNPGDPLPKAEALMEAKHWLRGLTGEEIEKLDLELLNGQVRGSVPGLTREYDSQESYPFKDPRYWAAFILIGDSR